MANVKLDYESLIQALTPLRQRALREDVKLSSISDPDAFVAGYERGYFSGVRDILDVIYKQANDESKKTRET